MSTVIRAEQLLESGNKVIESLKDAREILNSAERWGNEDLSSISSFLSIIKGTVTEAKYSLAQITIRQAEEELNHFIQLLPNFSIPDTLMKNLNNATLPEEIKTKNFFEHTLSHEQYEFFRNQIDCVIQSVSNVINYIKESGK